MSEVRTFKVYVDILNMGDVCYGSVAWPLHKMMTPTWSLKTVAWIYQILVNLCNVLYEYYSLRLSI